jgi:hypothetical protein
LLPTDPESRGAPIGDPSIRPIQASRLLQSRHPAKRWADSCEIYPQLSAHRCINLLDRWTNPGVI